MPMKNKLLRDTAEQLHYILKWVLHGEVESLAEKTASAALVDLAIRNGVGSLVFQFFQNCDSAEISGTLEARLLAYHASVLAQNSEYLSLAAKVEKHLREISVPVYGIKGIELIQAGLYAIGDRPLSDIDMLVPSRDVATGIMRELAKKLNDSSREHEFADRFTRLSREDGAVLRGIRGNPVMLELHFPEDPAFLPLPELIRMNANRLFASYFSTPSEPRNPRLPTEFHLLLLGVHLTQHHLGAKLIWYFDIARLLQSSSQKQALDWDLIVKQILFLDMAGVFRGLFQYLYTHLEVGIPPEVEKALRRDALLNRGMLAAMFQFSNTAGDCFCGAKIWAQKKISLCMARRQVFYMLFSYLFSDHATFCYPDGKKKIYQSGQAAMVLITGKPFSGKWRYFAFLLGLPVSVIFVALSFPIQVMYSLRRKWRQE